MRLAIRTKVTSSPASNAAPSASASVYLGDFVTSTFGGNLPVNQSLRLVFVNHTGCDADADSFPALQETQTQRIDFALAVLRGGCRFDAKALVAQRLGARLLLVIDHVADDALQRLGGLPPEVRQARVVYGSWVADFLDAQVGYVGIPGVLTTSSLYAFLSAAAPASCSLQLFPAASDVGAEDWLELAMMEWETDVDDYHMQLQGLLSRFEPRAVRTGKADLDFDAVHARELTQWVQRRLAKLLAPLARDQEAARVADDDEL